MDTVNYLSPSVEIHASAPQGNAFDKILALLSFAWPFNKYYQVCTGYKASLGTGDTVVDQTHLVPSLMELAF